MTPTTSRSLRRVFTSSGTFTAPNDGWYKVIALSGGGNGGNGAGASGSSQYAGGGGASGSIAISWVYLLANTNVSTTITTTTTAAGSGNNVSFGTYLTVAGGEGGTNATASAVGQGGRSAHSVSVLRPTVQDTFGVGAAQSKSIEENFEKEILPYFIPVGFKMRTQSATNMTEVSAQTSRGGDGGTGNSANSTQTGIGAGGPGGGGFKVIGQGITVYGAGGNGANRTGGTDNSRGNGTAGIIIVEG